MFRPGYMAHPNETYVLSASANTGLRRRFFLSHIGHVAQTSERVPVAAFTTRNPLGFMQGFVQARKVRDPPSFGAGSRAVSCARLASSQSGSGWLGVGQVRRWKHAYGSMPTEAWLRRRRKMGKY